VRGTFPSQRIRSLLDHRSIWAEDGIAPAQVQPASLDLTVSDEVYSVPGSMLPMPGESVRDVVQRFQRRRFSLENPETLIRGGVYVVRLREQVSLPPDVAMYANNKSSTGRIDVQTRLLSDGNPRYDRVPRGYRGPLWLEVIPKSFDLRIRSGDSLNQAIFYNAREVLQKEALEELHGESPLLFDPQGVAVESAAFRQAVTQGALLMTLDLEQDIVGYVAKKSFHPVDLQGVRGHDPHTFFQPIERPRDGALFLSREAFYIFSTYERIAIPPAFAAEMLPYDTSAGEFRAHYAGFFDPGFGFGRIGEVRGTPAVLEVRPYEDDLIVRHRQPVCKMAYERLSEVPDLRYGVEVKSNYATQRGPALSKFFRVDDA
jgi:dCTP deaminase